MCGFLEKKFLTNEVVSVLVCMKETNVCTVSWSRPCSADHVKIILALRVLRRDRRASSKQIIGSTLFLIGYNEWHIAVHTVCDS